ncbi:hypothetical protein K438DRAFT_2071629 [Mycena galopus ATCC 62051]|nr:hypothetical protein K438DRAFT_2071629 [Mycena galopus ATCC 62051]
MTTVTCTMQVGRRIERPPNPKPHTHHHRITASNTHKPTAGREIRGEARMSPMSPRPTRPRTRPCLRVRKPKPRPKPRTTVMGQAIRNPLRPPSHPIPRGHDVAPGDGDRLDETRDRIGIGIAAIPPLIKPTPTPTRSRDNQKPEPEKTENNDRAESFVRLWHTRTVPGTKQAGRRAEGDISTLAGTHAPKWKGTHEAKGWGSSSFLKHKTVPRNESENPVQKAKRIARTQNKRQASHVAHQTQPRLQRAALPLLAFAVCPLEVLGVVVGGFGLGLGRGGPVCKFELEFQERETKKGTPRPCAGAGAGAGVDATLDAGDESAMVATLRDETLREDGTDDEDDVAEVDFGTARLSWDTLRRGAGPLSPAGKTQNANARGKEKIGGTHEYACASSSNTMYSSPGRGLLGACLTQRKQPRRLAIKPLSIRSAASKNA